MKLFDQEVEFLPKKIWLSDFKFLHIKEKGENNFSLLINVKV